MTAQPELNRTRIQQILAAVGTVKPDDSPAPEFTEYDWRQPHYFTEEQLAKLEDFTNRFAVEITRKFSDLCHTDFDAEIVSVTQHFTGEILEQTGQELTFYYTAFGDDHADKPWGIIGFSQETAVTWATQMMGDTEAEANPRKELSSLELSLLEDITAAVVEAIANCNQSFKLKPTRQITRGNLPFEPETTDSLCKIVFSIKPAAGQRSVEGYILLPCAKLEPVTSKIDQAAEDFTAKEISEAISEHIREMSLPMTVQLDKAALTLEQAMQLGEGDIIILDKSVEQPVEVLAEGRRFFFGYMAKNGGRKAVQISEFSNVES